MASVYQCKITSKMNSTHSRYFDIDEVDSTNSSIFCKDVQVRTSHVILRTSVIDILYVTRDKDYNLKSVIFGCLNGKLFCAHLTFLLYNPGRLCFINSMC